MYMSTELKATLVLVTKVLNDRPFFHSTLVNLREQFRI